MTSSILTLSSGVDTGSTEACNPHPTPPHPLLVHIKWRMRMVGGGGEKRVRKGKNKEEAKGGVKMTTSLPHLPSN